MGAAPVELGRFAGDQQKGRGGGIILDSPAQPRERLAQVGAGSFFRCVGEKQAGEHFAAREDDPQVESRRPYPDP